MVAEQLQEIGDGILQFEHQRPRIRRADADGLEVLGLAGGESLGAADTVQHRGVFGPEARREHALVTEEKIGGGHRIAVRPARLGTQAEGPGLAVRRHRPALGHARDRVEVLGVVVDQAFEEGADDMTFAETGDGLRIEPGRLGHVVNDQVAFGRLFFDGGLTVAAARQKAR